MPLAPEKAHRSAHCNDQNYDCENDEPGDLYRGPRPRDIADAAALADVAEDVVAVLSARKQVHRPDASYHNHGGFRNVERIPPALGLSLIKLEPYCVPGRVDRSVQPGDLDRPAGSTRRQSTRLTIAGHLPTHQARVAR